MKRDITIRVKGHVTTRPRDSEVEGGTIVAENEKRSRRGAGDRVLQMSSGVDAEIEEFARNDGLPLGCNSE